MKDLFLSNGGWLLRVVSVSALVVVIGLSLFPRVVSHISTSAIVNAPILIIRSPIEGLVEDYALQNGSLVSQGQNIAVFREAGTDLTHLADLEARIVVAEAAAVAVEARIQDVEQILQGLQRRHRAYMKWHSSILEKDIEDFVAQLRGANARLDALHHEAERQSELFKRGMVPESQELEAWTRAIEQDERVQALEARLARSHLKLNALEDDLLAGTDGTNTSYTLQRQDEVKLELARLRDELIDHNAERTALVAQLIKEKEIFESENRITLASPIDGIVWRSASSNGRPVLPGDEIVEILDCRARYLEAYLPEGLMGSISVGDNVEVRLTGEAEPFSAPIASILGRGARFDHVELAAQDTAPRSGKMRVIIELSAETLALDRGKFCHVGRTAQVSMPRDLSGTYRIAALFSQSVRSAFAWLGTEPGDVQGG